ncbi:MAG: acetyl-CoA carboxylase biotin carboxyl carrier protein [Planctomycetes bacterium]|nr:acetyl-CoA carboxylase biotin carboxyl carrier protein [Planctomycetota bacterium]
MDLDRIQELLEIMEKYGLQSLQVKEDGVEYRFDKKSEAPAPPMAPVMMPHVVPGPPAAAGSAAAPAAGGGAEEDAGSAAIKAPMVGTFYRAPSPDAEPYVRVGDHVTPETVVCIVEAMKVMNEITADCTGTVKKILVENSQPVEYGQVMFLIEQN